MDVDHPTQTRNAQADDRREDFPDGRRERSRLSRARISDALLDLVVHGEPSPSAEQVARRAGVGLRSIFRHFTDMDSLFGELSLALEAAAEAHAHTPDPSEPGAGADPLSRLVDRRSRFFEDFFPVFEAVCRRPGRSGAGRVAEVLRRRTALDLGPGLAEGELHLADLLLSFEVWARLRREQGLSPAASRHALMTALERTLGVVPGSAGPGAPGRRASGRTTSGQVASGQAA